jgi:hypothetical protein
VAEKQPMARYTRPEDVGALAAFLAGDAAATITGASYSIDGGSDRSVRRFSVSAPASEQLQEELEHVECIQEDRCGDERC